MRDLIARTPSNDLFLYPGAGGGKIGPGRQIGSRWAAMDQIIPAGAMAGGATQYVVARNRLTGALWRCGGTLWRYLGTPAGMLGLGAGGRWLGRVQSGVLSG